MRGVPEEGDGPRGCHVPISVAREQRTPVQHARRVHATRDGVPVGIRLLRRRLQTRHHVGVVPKGGRAARDVVVTLHDPAVEAPGRPVQLITPDVHETHGPAHRAVLRRAQSGGASRTKLGETVVRRTVARSTTTRLRVCLHHARGVHHTAPDHPPVIPRRPVVDERGANGAVDPVGAHHEISNHRILRLAVPRHERAPRLGGTVFVLHELDAVQGRVQVDAVRGEERRQRGLRLGPSDADQTRAVLGFDDGGERAARQLGDGLLESAADAVLVVG